ncbi:class I SAM-dependent methyltransferase [Streptomyces sp. NBC_00370]|uniref:class I SAM-dependent methyltransferase n=1 Tax=Streptomyces sp. NBC_00370 TaxID=2975728 RepID=UPI002E26AEE6
MTSLSPEHDGHHGHHGHRHHDNAGGFDEPDMAELLDLDAEVLHAHLTDVTAWLATSAGAAGDIPVRRLLDLGSGTGTGTLALLQRFPDAEAVAVDASAPLLHRLRDKAQAQGVAERVRTVQADLDEAWPDFGDVDLVWTSAALHHMADPDGALREVFAALRPGGLLAVVEMEGFPRFLPDDLGIGKPGLEARLHELTSHEHAERVPHLGADWGPRLTAAGFTVESERRFAVDLLPPLPAATGRYAQAMLRRLRDALADRLGADDRSVLDTLLDSHGPDSVTHRGDLTVRTERPAWLVRRPTV